jgi:hypothetical protein
VATYTQSFDDIELAEDLDAFDPRFETIVGGFDGAFPDGGGLSTAGGGDHLARMPEADGATYVQWVDGVFAAGGYIGGGLRMSADGDGYAAISNGTTVYLNRYTNGSFDTTLATETAPAAGTLIRFEFSGSDWTLLFGGVEAASGTDATYATGAAGLGGYENVAGPLNDWEAGTPGGATFQAAWARNTNTVI